jgi:tRNA 2-thiouridine synthesizing protein A
MMGIGPRVRAHPTSYDEVIALAEIKIDCTGETCPVPLVETRKALRKAQAGDIVEVTGTHPSSKKEIPMAVKAMGLELLEIKEEPNGVWKIRIRK